MIGKVVFGGRDGRYLLFIALGAAVGVFFADSRPLLRSLFYSGLTFTAVLGLLRLEIYRQDIESQAVDKKMREFAEEKIEGWSLKFINRVMPYEMHKMSSNTSQLWGAYMPDREAVVVNGKVYTCYSPESPVKWPLKGDS